MIEQYKFCIKNRIIIPSLDDQFKTIEEIIVQRFKRKGYLIFMYYYKNHFYKEPWDMMMIERQKIEYWITICNQIIRNTNLCFDIRYIFIRFLV